jgi:adenine-specific DNA-methyltransferase
MELESRDVLAQKLEELKNIFPEIFDDGVINIDKFKNIVAPQTDEKSEHYSFNWSGKKECYQTIRQKSNATLKIDSSHSELDSGSNSNVFIEGDNLEVLKLLQTSYHKKIKMIYIDPPYNKDKDFVYKDTWGDTITNYLIQTDQLRDEGYTSTKTSSTGRRHTNWLNMIYPRLWLSRNLLKDDGVIFVSIDDDEVHNLRKVMNEIYGEENFIGNLIIQTATDNNPTQINTEHEYILAYAKNGELLNNWSRRSNAADLIIEEYKILKVKYGKDIQSITPIQLISATVRVTGDKG